MAITKIAVVLFFTLAAVSAAKFEKASNSGSKRAVDSYNYPSPVSASFSYEKESQPENRVIVETISSQGRYLPPVQSSSSLGEEENDSSPVNVSYEAYEQDDYHPIPSSSAQPSTTTTTTTEQPEEPATPPPKKSSGGLGAFKYYGGKGKSKSKTTSAPSVTASPLASFRPIQVKPATPKVEIKTQEPIRPVTFRPSLKTDYKYPSPKNALKPSKKEQRLSDSRGEESSQGYDYDVGPGSFLNHDSYSSGVVHNSRPALQLMPYQNPLPAAGNGMMGMGLSYMRQSSPFFSYHVMLD